MSEINDFGETIAGARKDAYSRWEDSIQEQIDESVDSLARYPLSKSWPEPNYEILQRDTPWVAAWLRALRESVGAKPRNSLRLRSWLTPTALAREVYKEVAQNKEQFEAAMVFDPNALHKHYLLHLKETYGEFQKKCHIEAHEVNLLAHVHYFTDSKRSLANLVKARVISTSLVETEDGGYLPTQYRLRLKSAKGMRSKDYTFGALSEVLETLEQDEFAQEWRDPKPKSTNNDEGLPRLAMTAYPNQKECSISFKRGSDWIPLETFATRELAREAMRDDSNIDKWLSWYRQWLEQNGQSVRNSVNLDRQGNDWRGGKDVTPALFSEAFGFRGVQFGNYVEGPQRQRDLNNAYDALMDLAYALNVAPNTLSLDGTLGLAFGARGRGGPRAALAHYETKHRVINLTKNKGAGSLAHEWFHALDHYLFENHPHFTNTDDSARRYDSHFLTDATMRYRVFRDSDAVASPLLGLLRSPVASRSENLDKQRSGKAYWSSTIEMGARCFEHAVKTLLAEQGMQNDYLVNVKDLTQFSENTDQMGSALAQMRNRSYPYPFAEEAQENMRHINALMNAFLDLCPSFNETFDEEQIYALAQPHQSARAEDLLFDDEEGNTQDAPPIIPSEPVTYTTQTSLF